MEDWVEERVGGWTAFLVKRGTGKTLMDVLKEGREVKAGRGKIIMHDGLGIVARFYRRGGLLGRFTGRLLMVERKRPLEELSITHRLYRSGLPVPEPLGVFLKTRWPWMEAAIFTRLIKGRPMKDALTKEREKTLKAIGSAIRGMHNRNILHRDLNVNNIIVGGDSIYIIDFDRARVKRGIEKKERVSQMLRLIRSMMKEGIYKEGDEKLIVEGYGMPLKIRPRKLLWRVAWALGL